MRLKAGEKHIKRYFLRIDDGDKFLLY